ncbi:multidrug efflux MFS transporter EmrD [Dryocola sp. LX212]|jgi:DHA1 family 2-module integral membrane pump EmrD-like MFS transporter
MRKLANIHLLMMLILLVAVGQMTQTIYIPSIPDIAHELGVRDGAIQRVMATYLLTYGISQLFYGPISDRIGRRPVILAGMGIFILATVWALFTTNLSALVYASALQGMGTGVAGVMARTMPRDLYEGSSLRQANSLLNMGILVSPLIAPVLGGMLDSVWGWRACYGFLLLLCMIVAFCMLRWLPETRPVQVQPLRLRASYKALLGSGSFNCYLLMLVGGLAGVAVFEACSGVLMGGVLGLNGVVVSILFILPIPAAFFGSWYAGRQNGRFSALMWQAVLSCLFAGILMWLPGWFGVMNIWTLIVPAALFFFGAGMLFPLATSGAMEPFPFLAGTAGALVGGLQNIGSGAMAWFSALLPQTGQFSLGMLMTAMGVLILLCWLPLSHKFQQHGEAA